MASASDTAGGGQPVQASALGHGGPFEGALADLRSTGDAQAIASLTLLAKVMGNVLGEPNEDKFKRLKKSAGAVQTNIVRVPGAVPLLQAFGFTDPSQASAQAAGQPSQQEQDDAFVVPKGVTVDSSVFKAVNRELLVLQAKSDPSKAAQLDSLNKREAARAEADKEKQKILQQAKMDREERQREEQERGVHASKATEHKFGVQAHRVPGCTW